MAVPNLKDQFINFIRMMFKDVTNFAVVFGFIGGMFITVVGVFAYLGDWLHLYYIIRPWKQISATIAIIILLSVAILVKSLSRYIKILCIITVIFMTIAVLDSLDGSLQYIPSISLALWFWAAIYIGGVIEICRNNQLSIMRRNIGIATGSAMITLYIGAAIYYAIINDLIGSIYFDHHPLYGAGIVLSQLLNWIGQMGSFSSKKEAT